MVIRKQQGTCAIHFLSIIFNVFSAARFPCFLAQQAQQFLNLLHCVSQLQRGRDLFIAATARDYLPDIVSSIGTIG